MGKKLPPHEMELYRRTDEVLHYLWDPIGLSDMPAARDEYEGYLPMVFDLLTKGADPQAIAQFLLGIEREGMGLAGDPVKASRVVEILIEYRDWIFRQD